MFKCIKNTSYVFIVLFFLILPFITRAVSCTSDLEGKSDAELQAISAQCDLDLIELNSKFENTKKYSSELEKGIAELNYNITKIQLEINAKNAKIRQLGDNIVVKKEYIGELSLRMDNIRDSIAKMIRDSYALGDMSMVDMLLSSNSISEFFIDTDDYSTINEKLQTLIKDLTDTRTKSEREKEDLENKKSLEAKLKYEQEAAKKTTELYKKEQQQILSISKNQEAEYKKLIAEKEALKSMIRNRLYRTASGMEISFGDALKLIQPYESAIGVNSALILAVLFQESAMDNTIGKNIGRCTYDQASPCVTGKTVMSDTQKPYYLEIMNNLNLNAHTSPVSCPICRDGNYGGAMGPAQFMPQTWTGISKRVSSILSISYPSPFNNLHAFTAAAVLLKDNQDRCKTAFTKKSDIWACAASKYYGGLNLKGTRLTNFMYYGYGAAVLKRALQFEKDIDTLSL